jgi:hypothetical protein
LLVIQPEYTLYSASSLREPLYSAFLMGALLALLRHRTLLFAMCGVLAFSIRFEAPLFLLPIGLFYLQTWRERLSFLVILFSGIGFWMIYCWNVFDTVQFWSHAAAVNVETGLGGGEENKLAWVLAGAEVLWGLLVEVLPSRIGWASLIAVFAFPYWWRTSQRGMLLWFWAMLMLGVWLAIAFVAQHEPHHNLYWKWLYPVIPGLISVASLTLQRALREFKHSYVFIAFIIGQAWWVQGNELIRQYQLSETLYRPQVELGSWIEDNISPDTPMLVDNIPSCWIGRRPNEFNFHSWFDVPHFSSLEGFSTWLSDNDVKWVLYFQEEWTQAPLKAPFLKSGGIINEGKLQLVERKREDKYGWIWFEVKPIIPDILSGENLPQAE